MVGGEAISSADESGLCKVTSGELPSRKMYEDESFLGILDIDGCAQGHCLIIPKST